MPLYLLHVKTFSRTRGGRVTRAAAYRAGEYIRDERTKEAYNFLRRDDVVYKDIVLPSRFARDATVNWARDRSTLWNAVESTNRRNARLAREVMVILPPEFTPTQRSNLVRRFSQELSDRYQNAVDTTIHLPRPGADERHHHAHLLMTPREITPQGLGPRIACELSGVERHARGLGPYKQDFMFVRVRWAELMNEALRDAGLTARVDHRGFRARGIDREPVPEIPQKILYMERRTGVPSQAGDDIRRRYRERVDARLKGGDELARVLQRQKEEGARRILEREKQRAASPKKAPWGSLTPEEISKRRQEWYQANRATAIAKSRAWRQKNADVIREKRRLARLRAKTPTEQQSIERLQKWREQRRLAATAARSARNGPAYRKRLEQRGTRRKLDRTRNHDLSL